MSRTLTRHEGSVGGERLAISAEAERRENGTVSLRYVLSGAIGDVALSPERPPARTDELWRTTCFEAFVSDGDGGYVEINLAPSTAWAAYRFDGYRSGMAPAEVSPPQVVATRAPERFTLTADVKVGGLSQDRPWLCGLTAVVEDGSGGVSYWALAHPGEKPDFHHPDSFVLELPAP